MGERETQAQPNPKIAELEGKVTDLQNSLEVCKSDCAKSEARAIGAEAASGDVTVSHGKTVRAAMRVIQSARKSSPGAAFAEVSVDLLEELQAAL